MFPIKVSHNTILLILLIFLFSLSIYASIKGSLILIIVTIASVFLSVSVVPVCRKRESLWMFVFIAIVGFPINVYVISYWLMAFKIYLDILIIEILLAGLCYCLLLSIEEIVIGLLTRLIWQKQYIIKF